MSVVIQVTDPEIGSRQETSCSEMKTAVPVQLEWQNISFSVTSRLGCCKKAQKKTILDNVSGFVRP